MSIISSVDFIPLLLNIITPTFRPVSLLFNDLFKINTIVYLPEHGQYGYSNHLVFVCVCVCVSQRLQDLAIQMSCE